MTAKAAQSTTKKAKTTKTKAAAASKTAKPSKAVSAPKPIEKAAPNSKLRAWNLRFGVVLLLEAIAVVVFGTSRTVEVTMQYLARDLLAAEVSGNVPYAAAVRHVADVQLSWIVAGFLAVFGLSMLLVATLWRKHYDNWLARGVNKLRWVGLGVGGGVAFVAVAMLSGITDSATLTLLFGSVALAGVFAEAIELLGSDRRLRRVLGFGAIVAVLLPCMVFVKASSAAAMYDGSIPVYLYFMYASLTLVVIATGLALYLRTKQRGKWVNTAYAESMFMGLGFVAATIIALQIFAGALQP
jgi:hypothetical protein